MMRQITVLAGGTGGGRFVRGLRHALDNELIPEAGPDTRVTVIVNTADDAWVHGLRVCPDLDSVTYTLADAVDPERGWGRRDETWSVREELAAYGAPYAWFGLGDRDLATHLLRTEALHTGLTLSRATDRVVRRWLPDHPVQLLPMTDVEVETHVEIVGESGATEVVHFQEYWIRLRAAPQVVSLRHVGVAHATPAPGVITAIETADVVVVAPSNPIVSVGPILAVPGIRETICRGAPVVGLSPIIGGSHVHGMANQLLEASGVEVSAAGVGLHYGARRDGGVLDAWLVAEEDDAEVARVSHAGIASHAVPLLMASDETSAAMAVEAVALAHS